MHVNQQNRFCDFPIDLAVRTESQGGVTVGSYKKKVNRKLLHVHTINFHYYDLACNSMCKRNDQDTQYGAVSTRNGKIAARSKWENRKIDFFDLQKIFYVSCSAKTFHIPQSKYWAVRRSQNNRSVFQTKVIPNQADGQALGILL